ncbi:MAG: sodium:proton antiporter NhaD, partial [Sediminibacterium sp.]
LMVLLIVCVFILGYIAITLEHAIHINKAASALITAVICWTSVITNTSDPTSVINSLSHHLSETSEIVFFLLGAMTIVELIDAHDGFQYITDKIKTNNKTKLIWLISLITFFLSAILDNLTTAIVMISILNKLIADKKTKWLLLGLVIISSNAGGAWSPIGDVTTTMLWIGGQITPLNIIKETFLASLVCMLIPTLIINYQIKGRIEIKNQEESEQRFFTNGFERNLIFFAGIACLLFVPIFKSITHLPPYMGMLFSLGLMWVITELVHAKKGEREKGNLSVSHALRKIDTPSILFFFGILISIASLSHIGFLPQMANKLDELAGSVNVVAISIGVLSSIFDNVPLVAALQSMYSLDTYPTDHYFWELLAYCAGTGGSCLIIGSAAGVVVMGMEKIDFFWYLKKISWVALIGFLSGAVVFILQNEF